MIRKVKIQLLGISNYSQSRYHNTPKLNKEKPAEYEMRTWKEKAWYNDDGLLYIPGNQFKKSLDGAASHLGEKIPGRGNKTWKSLFVAGVQCRDNVVIKPHYSRETIKSVTLMQDAGGSSGVKSVRVPRTFPIIAQGWEGEAIFSLVDSSIDLQTFLRHLQQAGQLVGIGRWRPQVGGTNGTFCFNPENVIVEETNTI